MTAIKAQKMMLFRSLPMETEFARDDGERDQIWDRVDWDLGIDPPAVRKD